MPSYSYDVKVNGVTPLQINLNGSFLERMKVNGTDVIHKTYSGSYKVSLKYAVKITNIGSSSDCSGSYYYGKANVVITPVISDITGDITRVEFYGDIMKTDQKITLHIDNLTYKSEIAANSTGSSFSKSWNFDYASGLALYQKNNNDNAPIQVFTRAYLADGSYKDSSGFLSVGDSSTPSGERLIELPARNTTTTETVTTSTRSASYREY